MSKIKNISQKAKIYFAWFILVLFFVFLSGGKAKASSLSLTPASGTYEVGSTFDVSVMLNTEGKSVNAVKVSLSFPPSSLQVVSPSVGKSSVALWTSPPAYNNATGTIKLEGGFPNGTNVTSGLIAKITFRVKSTGTPIVKFLDDSKVLLDNGRGTETLSQTNNGIYTLTLPAPAGPEVVSKTHPDQSRWYNNASPVLKWADPDSDIVKKYSYVLSDNPTEIPDDIPEGDKTSVAYKNLSDGRHYFHIKALNKDNIWGGTTHYALNIDSSSPAKFSVDIFPSSSTNRRDPVIQFATTDSSSGVDHYELKVVPLSNVNVAHASAGNNQQMFIEAMSPYAARNLNLGDYDVIVRAYDKAGNYRDSTKRLTISNAFFQFVSDRGLIIGGQTIISWYWFFLLFLVIIIALVYIIWRLHHHHQNIEKARKDGKIPPNIRKKIEELNKLKKKYKGSIAIVVLIVSSFFFTVSAKAKGDFPAINPPFITTISKNISNEEIFYVGGKAETEGEKITVYIKNKRTGETFNEEVSADKKGEWFYRHNAFLSDGNYILWAQSKIGDQLSAPSPQVQMTVSKTALQFGASRISYRILLSFVIIILFIILLLLLFYISLSVKKIRKKNKLFNKEVKEVDDAVNKGFMILHREIGRELKLMDKANSQKTLSEKEGAYRGHLMNDLKKIERHIEKEIVDVERLLN